MKILIFGRPGSGKTTAAHVVAKQLYDIHLSSVHLNDYNILHAMFLSDNDGNFRATEHGGFDVLNFDVMDIALQEMEKKVPADLSHLDVVTIEFARDNYEKAFKQFSSNFLKKDTYFLYLDTDVETCLQRIHERIARHASADDHPSLSDRAFRVYYGQDNRSYMVSNILRDYNLDKGSVRIIDNTGSLDEFCKLLEDFVHSILPVPAVV